MLLKHFKKHSNSVIPYTTVSITSIGDGAITSKITITLQLQLLVTNSK